MRMRSVFILQQKLLTRDRLRGRRVMIERMISLLVACVLSLCSAQTTTYVLDTSVGLGRQFDGIGGLSGGGVSCASRAAMLHVA